MSRPERLRMKILWFSIAALFSVAGCSPKPTLRPYIPQDPVKIVYVDSEDVSASGTIEIQENRVAPVSTAAATVVIKEASTAPNPVRVNTPFDIRVKFLADVRNGAPELPAEFYFKVSQNNQELFTSKRIALTAENGVSKTFDAHMDPVPVAGEFAIHVFIASEGAGADKEIILRIVE